MDYILTSYGMVSSDYLAHHGIKGMKWGVRRYQKYGEGGYVPDGKMQGALKKHKAAMDRYDKAKSALKKNIGKPPVDDLNKMNEWDDRNKSLSKEKRAAKKEASKSYSELKKAAKYDKNRATALSTTDKKEVLKRQGYLSNEELHSKVGRMQDVDYLRQKTVKQYSEGQKAAIHVMEKLATTAITAGAVVIAAKVAKKKLQKSPVFQQTMKSIRATAEAGRKAAEKAAAVKDSAEKVVKNVNKITDSGERAARIAARAAERKGGVEAAKKVYQKVKKLHS